MGLFSLTGTGLARTRVCLIVVPSFLLFGYNQSNMGGVLNYPSFIRHFPEINTSTTTGNVQATNAKTQGTVVAIYTIGCLIGSLGITQVGNRLGRRKSLIIAAVIAAIGQIIQSSSFSLGQLVVGRVISGIGNGGVNAVVPVWQSECTAPKSRGKNVVIIGIFIASGVAAAGWVNVGFSFINTSEVAWRFPLAVPVVFTLMIMSFTPFFPESPRWLISKGRLAEAHEVMRKLSRDDTNEEVIRAEINNISSLLQQTSQSERGFIDLLKPGPQRLLYRMCLAIGINFCAQMTGANVISYYGSTIFKESLGLGEKKAALLNAGVLTWKIVAATSAYLTVDRYGRKPLFISAGLGMGLSMAGLAGSVWAIDHRDTFGASVAATFFLFSFMAFFPLGFLGANFLYSAEIAPQDLRIHLAAIGTATHWLFNFVIAEISPIALVTIRWKYYIVYAVVGVGVAVLVYFLFPETNCRSLEEMDELFSDPDHWWQVPGYARGLRMGSGETDNSPAKTSVVHVEKV
ncbi:general substrate transporter [Aspergillus sclerotioniger CBS 115572]|uniref:General substrate transporter n=1 Tax=Aspergillus sclerotioniger CBS 115572 TaxID=1450535 RepID=A0A317W6H7_9EURO|nr:general substrate transporter [Aspergillus sclerotioniger CBS 115572]PWY80857.1 general substrate transporter [Aspergillus sclerotioniger CBS 115572]